MSQADVSNPKVLGLAFTYDELDGTLDSTTVTVIRDITGGGLENMTQSESRDVWDELTVGQKNALASYLGFLLGLGW